MKIELLSWLFVGIALCAAGQEPRPETGGSTLVPGRGNHEESSCWLQAAFDHQVASYEGLVKTRGLPPPPEEEIRTAVASDFPPQTGVLIYDYVAPWVGGTVYAPDQMVVYRGALFKRLSSVHHSAVADSPAQDKEGWRQLRSCPSTSGTVDDRPMLRVWLVSKEGIDAYAALPFSPEKLSEAIRALDRSLRLNLQGRSDSARGFVADEDAGPAISMDEALSDLSDILMPRAFWQPIHRFNDVIVVPQLAIAEVPFPLLRGADGSRLIDTTTFWIARNIQDIGESEDDDALRVQAWDGGMKFTFESPLVVGNPAFQSADGFYLPPLPGAEEEAKAVASIMQTKPLIGNDASKEVVESRAKSADAIYIATHGAAMPDDPLSGFLALAGAPDASGRWSAKEIQGLDLSKTDLAVLSACQTGLGGIHAAGVIGVGRAFTLAGARWVVMSLWNVDDKATSELMQDFVRGMAACSTVHACLPAEALRKAMLAERSRNPDPKAWGAFVVFGVPDGKRLHR